MGWVDDLIWVCEWLGECVCMGWVDDLILGVRVAG